MMTSELQEKNIGKDPAKMPIQYLDNGIVQPASTLVAALDLLNKGFNVFPCHGYSEDIPDWFREKHRKKSDQETKEAWCKTPVVPKWAHLRSEPLTEEKIRGLWSEHPDANIAVINEDLVVLDADNEETVNWCMKNVLSPVRVLTKKGCHLYFRRNPGLEIKGSASEVCGLDIRAVGNYVIGAGSTHGSGHRYTWDIDEGYEFTSIEDLPEMTPELWEKIQKYINSAANTDIKKTVPTRLPFDESHPERGFNNYLTRLVGRWINEGYSEPELFEKGLSWNNTAEDPMPMDQALKTIKSIIDGHNKRHPEQQVPLYCEKDLSHNEDEVLTWMNRRHFAVTVGSSHLIAWIDPANEKLTLLKKENFKQIYENKFLEVIKKRSDQTKKVQVTYAEFWLAHPKRREYRRLVFKPSERDVRADEYNLFRGYNIDEKKLSSVSRRDCRLWLRYLRDIVCSGDKQLFNYLLNWCADAVQNPEDKPGVALVLRSFVQGTGKTFFSEHFGEIFGCHYQMISDSDLMTGTFNDHLEDCLLLGVEEAVAAEDKKAKNKLKDLITSDKMTVTRKFCTAETGKPNFIRIIFTSNEERVVDVGPHDRRFQLFDVSSRRKNDRTYFKDIHEEWINGGKEAFFKLLKRRNIDGFDFVKSRVINQESMGQKQLSWNKAQKWFHQILDEGGGKINTIENGLVPSPTFHFENDQSNEIHCDILFEHYLQFHRQMNGKRPKSKAELSKMIKRWCPDMQTYRRQELGEKITVWVFPSLKDCREAWDSAMGVTMDWND